MSWAEIKRAINSTVGTDEFQPLDKMIMGNWNLVESNNTYLFETPLYSSSAGTHTLSTTFKMKANGTARIRLLAAYSANITCAFEIYKNGQLYKSNSLTGINTSTNVSFIVPVSFKTDDLFTFKLVRTIGSGNISSINEISVLCDAVYAPVLIESL